MEQRDRVELIREGNRLFNEGKLEEAEKIFVKTRYKDGLTRIGDYFFYEKKLPLYAYKYYKMADCKDKVDEIFDRMVFALGHMMHDDGTTEEKAPEPPKVHPKLKILAEEIIRDNNSLDNEEKE